MIQEDITLKEFIESKLEAIKIAIEKSENSLNVRLEHMNEFRQQIQNERVNFVTRELYEAHIEASNKRFQDLERLVYIGFGIVVAIEVCLRFFIK